MLNQILSLITRRKADESKLEKNVSFCDSCGEICTPECRAKALLRQNEALTIINHPRV